MQYVAFIADIKRSRKYQTDKRAYLQVLMEDSLAFLNALFRGGIAKNVVFSAGDEVQGLFYDLPTAYLYYRSLDLLMGPHVLRGGLGVGAWDVRVESGTSTSQDGEAYHRARSAIYDADKNKRFDLVFCLGENYGDFLTTLADHSLGIAKMRTMAQNEIALAIELFYPLLIAAKDSAAYKEEVLYCRRRLLGTLARNPARYRKRAGLIEKLAGSNVSDVRDYWEPLELERSLMRKEPFHIYQGDIVGASYALAGLSGMARQGLDRVLVQGRIAQERNAAAFFIYCALQRFGR